MNKERPLNKQGLLTEEEILLLSVGTPDLKVLLLRTEIDRLAQMAACVAGNSELTMEQKLQKCDEFLGAIKTLFAGGFKNWIQVLAETEDQLRSAIKTTEQLLERTKK